MKSKNVLVIAAHPDDEILGCGGTMARMAKEGYKVFSLILGEGVTSRDDKRDTNKRETELKALKDEIQKANKILGVVDVMTEDLPDNRFDSVPMLDVVKKIEKVTKEIQPEIIFTHYGKDLNIDHQVTYRAVLTATRPLVGETVKEIYTFEVLSSTEWNYPLSFSPNHFYDISDTLDLKVKAMAEYHSELREYPHPRSLKAIELNAQNWGYKVGQGYSEAFEVVRVLR